MRNVRLLRKSLLFVATTLLSSMVVWAQVIVPPQPSNQVAVTATTNVGYDSTTGLYTYTYTFNSAANSVQPVWHIAIETVGDAGLSIVNAQSPRGWSFVLHSDGTGASWAATDPGQLPAGYVDDGGVPPSPYAIQPGNSLSGFSFQSRRPPTAARFYAQGFAPLPEAVDAGDLDATGFMAKDYTEDSIIGLTSAPTPTSFAEQSSGLGTITVIGVTNGASKTAPVTISIRFNSTAPNINKASFTAALNGADITPNFQPAVPGTGVDLTAVLNVVTSALQNGRNTLSVSVAVTPSGSVSSTFDFSYISFYVNSTRPADLNGDGMVNCQDLAIVKASFGKRTGQTGFDPRADVNGDGIVNLLDLSAVSKQVPSGTVCQ